MLGKRARKKGLPKPDLRLKPEFRELAQDLEDEYRKKKGLQLIFQAISNLDMEAFMDEYMSGFKRNLSDGEKELAIALKELNVCETNDPGKREEQKGVLLGWLVMIQTANIKHPGFWEKWEDGRFSELAIRAAKEYARIADLAKTCVTDNRPGMSKADEALLDVYERNWPIWCCIEQLLWDDWCIKPDYSKARRPQPDSTPPS